MDIKVGYKDVIASGNVMASKGDPVLFTVAHDLKVKLLFNR